MVREKKVHQVQLLRIGEAAAILGSTEGALREGMSSGRLSFPTVRLGRRGIRIKLSDVEAYVAKNTIAPAADGA